MVGFNGQTTISATVPTALVAGGQKLTSRVHVRSMASGAVLLYMGFYANDTDAAALTGSTGFPIAAGVTADVDVGALKTLAEQQSGDLKYLYLLSSSGSVNAGYWGI